MKINSLADCPKLVPVVAQWHCSEWGHFYPGGTVEGWLAHIRTRVNADRIPMTVVALVSASDIRQLVVYVVGEQASLSAAWKAVTESFNRQVPPATLLGGARLGYAGQLVEVAATVLTA